jgi:hypothetical protein
MAGTISRRLLANAVAARLVGVTNATGYYGQIGRPLTTPAPTGWTADPQPKSPTDARVKPYFVLYPGAGGQGPDPDAADQAVDLTQPFRVTAAAGDIEDLLALIDRIEARLIHWVPDLGAAGDGIHIGSVRRPLGVPDTAPVLTDTQFNPHRLYTPLQYQLTATT